MSYPGYYGAPSPADDPMAEEFLNQLQVFSALFDKCKVLFFLGFISCSIQLLCGEISPSRTAAKKVTGLFLFFMQFPFHPDPLANIKVVSKDSPL